MEERQKEYEEWQKEMAEQIDDRFKIQSGKVDSLQKTEKLNEETSRFAALNNGMHMDMTMLQAKFEQLEKTHNVQAPLITPVTPNAEEKLKARSTSPSAESHKKRHKSLDT
eukprot:300797-Ditylum_brightwellii.AAC.1